MEAIDAALAAEARGRATARGLLGLPPLPAYPAAVGRQVPFSPVVGGRDWFVNGEGQTYAVVRGPVEVAMGNPLGEPGRLLNETPHRKRIGRNFVVSTRGVSAAEFLRFQPRYEGAKRYNLGPDTPAGMVTWYDCAAYCNWLSERESLPPGQWCYLPNEKGEYAEGMRIRPGHLWLTGYRLPTEAEWEFACRAGAGTARYFGRPDELLPRYAWYLRNAEDRPWPCGLLRPNDLGLFDALENAFEFVEDTGLPYDTGQTEDIGNGKMLLVEERIFPPSRGGTYTHPAVCFPPPHPAGWSHHDGRFPPRQDSAVIAPGFPGVFDPFPRHRPPGHAARGSTPATTSPPPRATRQVSGSPRNTTARRITRATLRLSTEATLDAGASCTARS